ncbi:MAG TPA: DUF1178 family protein [Burkholderiales bacterium]|jgi:hypothetical protein|nr:DUF1178 family protein [Burkholderiales bacterium]
MIVFNLSCEKGHRFEGWFGSSDDFSAQVNGGSMACPLCGSLDISRRPSAPYVSTRSGEPPREPQSVMVANAAQLLHKKFIEYVLQNTEDVGKRFPDEARRIHYKEVGERAIRGTASMKDVAQLKEEGIDVLAVSAIPVPPEKLH